LQERSIAESHGGSASIGIGGRRGGDMAGRITGKESAMNVRRLVCRELLHRRMNFALGVLAVTVAVGSLVSAIALLAAHDARTEQIMSEKHEQTRVAMAEMEDDYRKITKQMG